MSVRAVRLAALACLAAAAGIPLAGGLDGPLAESRDGGAATFTMYLMDGPRRWTTAILVVAAIAGLVVLVTPTRGRARLYLALAASMVVLAALSLAGLLIGYWHVDHDPGRRPRLLMPGAPLTLGPLTWHMALAVALAAAGVAAAWHGRRSRS